MGMVFFEVFLLELLASICPCLHTSLYNLSLGLSGSKVSQKLLGIHCLPFLGQLLPGAEAQNRHQWEVLLC